MLFRSFKFPSGTSKRNILSNCTVGRNFFPVFKSLMKLGRYDNSSYRAELGAFGPLIGILEQGFVFRGVPIHQDDFTIKLVALGLLEKAKKAGLHPAVHVPAVVVVAGVNTKAKIRCVGWGLHRENDCTIRRRFGFFAQDSKEAQCDSFKAWQND